MIKITKGNLLEAKAEALVNTVNTVGVMGKGIALQFKKAFPENYEAYKKACDAGSVEPGRMFVFELSDMFGLRYIVNFPTKRHWKGKSKMADVESGLKALATEIKERGIRSIAIPPLGCGLGGLPWPAVRKAIEEALGDLEDVKILLYEPAGAPLAKDMSNRTKRPNMTIGRAAILGLMSRYHETGFDYRLSLLEIQKLAYFMQEAGQPLKLNYAKNYYGPYADNLRQVLSHIEGHFTTGYGDGKNAPSTPVSFVPEAAQEAENFLANHPETLERFNRVTELIQGFETPYGMELLSTVHWVCTHQNEAAKNAPDIAVREVQAWSQRKKRMMPPKHITVAWNRLKGHGWI